jgi:Bacterial SH3 domain
MKTTLTALALCCALAACKNETKPAVVIPPVVAPVVDAPAPAPPAKPELFLYAASMNDLRVREQPNLTANVIEKVKNGEILTGSGDISSNKDSAVINGMSYKEPWYAVKTASGKAGWVFGGGIEPAYIGTMKDAPDVALLTKFNAHLASLPIKDVSSGKKALDFFLQNFKTANTASCDAAAKSYYDFLRKMQFSDIYKLTEKMKFSKQDMEDIWKDKYDLSKTPATKQLAANGFRLETAEGSIFPIADWEFVNKQFAGRLSAPMQSYIDQSIKEQTEPISSDGGLMITASEVANRAVFWEKFVSTNSASFLAKEAKKMAKQHVEVLITGMNNTPTFDYEKKMLSPDFQTAYEYLLKTYPTSQAAKKIGAFYDLVKAEGMKKTAKVEAAMK